MTPRLAVILILALGACDGRAPSQELSFPGGFDENLDSLLSAHGVPGAGVALVSSSAVLARGFGETRSGDGAPVTPGTVFEGASLGKPVFAYAVWKLVRSGSLELDAPLSRYLRAERAVPGVTDRVTSRMVLSHTSGLPNWPDPGEPGLVGAPGEEWRYSGYGYVLLQHTVEDLLARPLQQVMDSLVFGPLKMESSSYVWRDAFDTLAATGHDSEGEVQPKSKPGPDDADRLGAASSFHTTTADLARFASAVLQDPEHLRRAAEGWVPVDRDLGLGWGLGWAIERLGGGRHFFHWGANPGFRSFVLVSPHQRRGFVLLTNGQNGLEMADDVVSLVMDTEHPLFRFYMLHPSD